MTEDVTKPTEQRSWLERLSHTLLGEPKDREELIKLLRDAEAHHLLDNEALSMIEGVLQVSEMQVRDIMIPRSHMVTIDSDQKPEDFIPAIIDSAHSRFPVVGENRDEVIGIILAKDMLRFLVNQKKPFEIKQYIRTAIFVPESKRLNVLLREFRLNHNHMAIVIDEYGGISGLVTIEDVLEQIVGEIEDEFDVEEEENIKKLDEMRYTIKALTPIEEFNEYFKAALSDDEFDTVGGVIMNQFGHLPKRGETTSMGNFTFKILHADNRRIRLVEVIVK